MYLFLKANENIIGAELLCSYDWCAKSSYWFHDNLSVIINSISYFSFKLKMVTLLSNVLLYFKFDNEEDRPIECTGKFIDKKILRIQYIQTILNWKSIHRNVDYFYSKIHSYKMYTHWIPYRILPNTNVFIGFSILHHNLWYIVFKIYDPFDLFWSFLILQFNAL